jgi:hypothetical protein
VIDHGDYKVALDLAKADVASKAADLEVKRNENERRRKLTDLAASIGQTVAQGPNHIDKGVLRAARN